MSGESEASGSTPVTPGAPEPTASAGAAEQPASLPAPVSQAAPAASERPKPAFGEYAPEGWSWTPPEEAAPASASQTAPASSVPTQTGSTHAAAGNTVPGVPHNLGARSGASSRPAAPAAPAAIPVAPPQPSAPQPTAPDAKPAPAEASPAGEHYRAPAPAGPPSAAPKRRGVADRVISILLLVIGAYGALNMAMTLMTLPDMFNLMANAAQIENFSVSDAVRTTATVGAIVILAIYAVNLIFTIQRLRARKKAFWVPLVACAIALVASFVVMLACVMQAPELVAFSNDPDAMNKLIESLTKQ